KGDGDSATGQTHRPLLIPPRRGRRPRRPAPTARQASAERERKGIRALPGPKVSPRGTRLMRTATRNGQPSPAGGRRYALCADRPVAAIFSFGPSTAHFLFVKNKKKMGGGMNQPSSWPHLPGDHRSPLC